jgi:hypothetical protein
MPRNRSNSFSSLVECFSKLKRAALYCTFLVEKSNRSQVAIARRESLEPAPRVLISFLEARKVDPAFEFG